LYTHRLCGSDSRACSLHSPFLHLQVASCNQFTVFRIPMLCSTQQTGGYNIVAPVRLHPISQMSKRHRWKLFQGYPSRWAERPYERPESGPESTVRTHVACVTCLDLLHLVVGARDGFDFGTRTPSSSISHRFCPLTHEQHAERPYGAQFCGWPGVSKALFYSLLTYAAYHTDAACTPSKRAVSTGIDSSFQ
jgi:hypothetical protein